jgi:hypothetical protein
MRPWDAEGLEWDDINRDKLWSRQIGESEVEEVFWNRPVWGRNKAGRTGDFLMVGITDGGRRLTIPVQMNPINKQLRPVTGWESSTAELSRYGGRRR